VKKEYWSNKIEFLTTRRESMSNPYELAFQKSISDPVGFWGEAVEDCHWYKKWDKVLDDSNKPFYRWFVGGRLTPAIMLWTSTSKKAGAIRLPSSMIVPSQIQSRSSPILNYGMKWPNSPEHLSDWE
jgi:hypothetical protein